MKKINILKLVAAAFLLSGAGNAAATIVPGEYNFSADFQLVDDSYAGTIDPSLPFTISSSGVYTSISGFLNPEFSTRAYAPAETSDEFSFDMTFIPPLAFANAQGDYPEVYYDAASGSTQGADFFLTWTFDDAGRISIPDFTIVTLDRTAHTTSVVARFSSCKAADASMTLPKLDQLAGDYSFSSTLTDVAPDYQNYFAADFDFTAEYNTVNNMVNFIGFVNEEYDEFIRYNAETGEIQLNQFISQYPDDLLFANAQGEFPMAHHDASKGEWIDDWFLTMTIDGQGVLTIPDFTVVKADLFDGTCEVVARFSGITAMKTDGFGESVTVDIPGSYTVRGTMLDFTGAADPTAAAGSFTLTIGDNGELFAIAGYDEEALAPIVAAGYDTGYIEGTYWSIPAYKAFLEKEGVGGATRTVALSGVSTESYQDGAEITLSYADGKWSLTDFTVWSQKLEVIPGDGDTDTKYETVSTLLYAWQDMTVVKGEGGEQPGDEPEAWDFTGSHQIMMYKTDYTDISNPVTTYEPMTITINAENQYTALGGYEVTPTFIEYGYNQGQVNGNIWSIELNSFSNVIELDMQTGAGILVKGTSLMFEEDQPAWYGDLFLEYKDGAYAINDFTIWRKSFETVSDGTDADGNQSSETETVWTLLCMWSNKGQVTTVTPLVVPESSEDVYYDLSGRRVANPDRGIYIRIRDGKATKVVL